MGQTLETKSVIIIFFFFEFEEEDKNWIFFSYQNLLCTSGLT